MSKISNVQRYCHDGFYVWSFAALLVNRRLGNTTAAMVVVFMVRSSTGSTTVG